MDAVLDPQLLLSPLKEEDSYDVKPKVEPGLKVEIPDNTFGLEKNDDEDEEMEDLFGDDEDGNTQQEQSASPSASASGLREGSEVLSASELKHRKELEYEEPDDREDSVLELKHASLEIPNIPQPRSSDGNNWIFRIPNFVKLDPKPFHPVTYVGPDQSEEYSQAENRERSMSIKLEVENTIRWKWSKDELGNDFRRSNSRVIRWSDGTLSFLLGKELFDINQSYEGAFGAPLVPSGSSSSLSQSQGMPTQSSVTAPKPPGLAYLVAQHKRSGILQAETPITGTMSLRPTGMQSETHRLLARAVGQKHSKVARLRMAPDPIVDPERALAEIVKQANKKPRRTKGEGSTPARKRRSYGRRRSESVWSDEEPEPGAFGDTDEEDDEAAYGGSSERRSRHSGHDQEIDRAAARRGAGEYQTDDFLVADSDEAEEEESDEGSRKRKKRKRSSGNDEDNEGEVDALDEIDAKIAQQEEERRKRKQTDAIGPDGSPEGAQEPRTSGEDVEMDVESEEDDEEVVNLRRSSGNRRKRAIAQDEDEEEE